MAELSTLARPYARAAFEHARSAKDLQGWLDALFLASSVSQHATIVALLSSPNLTGEQKSATFIEVCGDKLDAKQQNFIKILAENKRLGLLPEVYQLFDLYKANQEKSIDVVIKTPFKITPALKKKLVAALTKKLDREVTLQTSIDESLMGGALIRAGDMVIDGSLKGRLAKLAEAMSA